MPRAIPITDLSSRPRGPMLAYSAADCDALAATLKALGDPVRLRLFLSIASSTDALCVCEIPDVGVSQPTVSHHLRKLREADLIDSERRGTWVYYWLTARGLRAASMLDDLAG